jgi:hypothetical protein
MNIDMEHLFKEALQNGINIFTGSGFSTLAAPDGTKLPTVSELCPEICAIFNIPDTYGNDLAACVGSSF